VIAIRSFSADMQKKIDFSRWKDLHNASRGFRVQRFRVQGLKAQRLKPQLVKCRAGATIPPLRRIYVPAIKRQPQRAARHSHFHLSSALWPQLSNLWTFELWTFEPSDRHLKCDT
jgi:hypothetical protein